MEYQDWDLPEPDQDFESKYEDELDMLNEFEDDILPEKQLSSRRVLDFQSPEKERNIPLQNNALVTSLTKKRNVSEKYQSLSDEEDEDLISSMSDLVGFSPNKKRQRLDESISDDSTDFQNHPIIQQEIAQPTERNQPQSNHRQANYSQRLVHGVHRRPLLGKDCITVTSMDGSRVYVCLQEDKEGTAINSQVASHGKSGLNKPCSLQLLSQPFSTLRQQVDEERRRTIMEESEKLTRSLRELTEDIENMTEDVTEVCADEPSPEENALNQNALWVEKYAPRHYTELLSDDFVNRTLLGWLKLWDTIVFGRTRDNQKKTKTEEQAKQKPTGNYPEKPDWEEMDSSNRPVYKVALLCGPPGLGKTTLAHVIAKHAGYNVVEMNASDDRSADIFQQRIEAATQMKSVLDPDKRPNCLVIDEIDGAPSAAINVLLNIIKKKDTVSTQKRKKKKVPQLLSKPIICICNDLYTPALRPLRQLAFVIAFPPTVPSRLATRLLHIARGQKLKTDMTTLLALCEKAENDVRSCLNTLQFVHSKRLGELLLHSIQSMDIGQKDAHKSLFSVWQEIFTLPQPKRQRFALPTSTNSTELPPLAPLRDMSGGNTGHSTTTSSRFHNILHTAISNSQFDKVSQGIFENYLNVKFKDPNFELVTSGTEWLEFTDFIQEKVNHSQTFILQRFFPFLSVSFHMFFACPTHTRLKYPSMQYENSQKLAYTKNTLTAMAHDVSPHIRHNLDTRIAILDLLPSLLQIITPTLRPVNTQLYSAKEKQQLQDLISTMIAYNVTYHQQRNQDGQYTYILDPNIEELIKFPGLPQHKQLTYAAKQLIAREIDLEKMRRAENAIKSLQTKSSVQEPEPVKKTTPQVVLKMKPKPKPKEDKPVRDFFGRVIKPKEQTQGGKDVKNEPIQVMPGTLWFRFNEGFSNAVRTSVKMKDLF